MNTEKSNRAYFDKCCDESDAYLISMARFIKGQRPDFKMSENPDRETMWGCLQFMKTKLKDDREGAIDNLVKVVTGKPAPDPAEVAKSDVWAKDNCPF